MYRRSRAGKQKSRAMLIDGQLQRYGLIFILWACCCTACGCPAEPVQSPLEPPSPPATPPDVPDSVPDETVPELPEPPSTPREAIPDEDQPRTSPPPEESLPAPREAPKQESPPVKGESASRREHLSPTERAALTNKAKGLLQSAKSNRKGEGMRRRSAMPGTHGIWFSE